VYPLGISNSHFKTFVLFSGVYQPCNSTIINDRIGPPTILAIKNMRTISIMRIAGWELWQVAATAIANN
jgi:hypothetical protein